MWAEFAHLESELHLIGFMSEVPNRNSPFCQPTPNNPFYMRLFSFDVLSIPPISKQKLKAFIHLAKLVKYVWGCEYKRVAPLNFRRSSFADHP